MEWQLITNQFLWNMFTVCKSHFRISYFLYKSSHSNTDTSTCVCEWFWEKEHYWSPKNYQRKRSLRILYKEHLKSYIKLLDVRCISSVHQNHIDSLAIQVYKLIDRLNLEFMRGFFSGRKNFDKLRAGVQLNIHQVKNREYGINSSKFWGILLWNSL